MGVKSSSAAFPKIARIYSALVLVAEAGQVCDLLPMAEKNYQQGPGFQGWQETFLGFLWRDCENQAAARRR